MNLELAREFPTRWAKAFASLCLVVVSAAMSGCGSGGGGTDSNVAASPTTSSVSSSYVTGVAATGAPLVGEVTLKESSSARREKVAILANDGSFAIDVTGLQPPYLLKAKGTVDAEHHTLYSFAEQAGTANVNPLTSVALAHAASVKDPSEVFDKGDSATLAKMTAAMPNSVATLKSKLLPLLEICNAGDRDPLKDSFVADHDGLDGVLDNARFALANGYLTVTNRLSGAVLFTAQITDLEHGQFTEHLEDLPKCIDRLPAPTGVTAVGGDGLVTISWNPVAGATSYDVYYKQASATSALSMHDEEELEFEDELWLKNVTSPFVLKNLAPNATYVFVVRARGNDRRGYPSAPVSATTTSGGGVVEVPAAPVGVAASGGTRQVSVSWPAVVGATSYNLYWSGTPGVTMSNGTLVSGVTSPAVLTGLADGATYYFIVTASNSAGESSPSVQVSATTLTAGPPPATVPSAPSGMNATGGNELVTVSWSAVSGATSYNMYWSTSFGVTTATGTRIAGVTSPYVHIGRTASTTYYYIVTAVNGAGESTPSTEVSATTNAPPLAVPAAPTGVVATGGNQAVTVAWNPASGATSYNLYWSPSPGVTVGTGTRITGVVSPYTQSGLAAGASYYYVVTAANSAGESVASAEATATTDTAAPPPIDGAALYTSYCSGCHGPLGASDYQGASAALITTGIANVSAMRTRFNATSGTVVKLTPEEIAAIAAALQ